MSRILVDLDDTIADWSARYDQGLEKLDLGAFIPRSAEQTQFNLMADRSPLEQAIIREVMNEPGYYLELDPIDGAIDALHEMVAFGHEVFIVTSPWVSNPTCASDKLRWVANHLGNEWTARTIITGDKTIIQGDILFDDKGYITGANKSPSWIQVHVTQPHNRSVIAKVRLNNWGRWPTAVARALRLQREEAAA